MVTRKDLLQAVRNGQFVPFPFKNSPLDIQSQLNEFFSGLYGQDLVDSVLYTQKHLDHMPNTLTPKERLFCRSLRNGLIDLKVLGSRA